MRYNWFFSYHYQSRNGQEGFGYCTMTSKAKNMSGSFLDSVRDSLASSGDGTSEIVILFFQRIEEA